jgi:hypothetical protein
MNRMRKMMKRKKLKMMLLKKKIKRKINMINSGNILEKI